MNPLKFRVYLPVSLRIWHWLNVMVIFGLLLTVLLRKTLFSWRANSVIIEQKLQMAGTTVAPETAKDIAIALRDHLWIWHVYLGYTLAALILFRIFIMIFIQKKCLSMEAIKNFKNLKLVNPEQKQKATKMAMIRLLYVIFYIFTVLMVITGLIMAFEETFKFAESTMKIIEEFHEVSMWFFILFIASHILGLIKAEVTDEPGLISDMINGGPKN